MTDPTTQDAGVMAANRTAKTLPFGGDDLFHVTAAGAVLALEPGESLDGEDFPKVTR